MARSLPPSCLIVKGAFFSSSSFSVSFRLKAEFFFFFLNRLTEDAGEAHSLKVEKVLFQGKSDYQDVIVFQVTQQQRQRQ